MNDLLAAIEGMFSGSVLWDTVGGRIYRDIAPTLDCPYVIWSVISSTPQRTFTEYYQNTVIQFTLCGSKAGGAAIMGQMYEDLKALFDECELTMTDSTLVWMREVNLVTMAQELDTPLPDGSDGMYMWCVDYEVYTSLD